MPFGAHKGRDLRDIEDDYLYWLLSLRNLREPLRLAIQDELERRQAPRVPSPALPGELVAVAGEIVTAGYKALARRHHPDVGGTHEDMLKVNEAAEALRRLLGRSAA